MNFNCEEQLSGFARLDFLLLEETNNWPLVVTDVTSSQIEFKPFRNDVHGTIDPESILVNVNDKNNAEGVIYSIDIKFSFITRSEAIEQLLDQYQNKPGVVIGYLNNEFRKIYGTFDEPLFLNFVSSESQKIDSSGAIQVKIKGETRCRPVFYTV